MNGFTNSIFNLKLRKNETSIPSTRDTGEHYSASSIETSLRVLSNTFKVIFI